MTGEGGKGKNIYDLLEEDEAEPVDQDQEEGEYVAPEPRSKKHKKDKRKKGLNAGPGKSAQ